MKGNTTFNYSEEYERAQNRAKGITAATPKEATPTVTKPSGSNPAGVSKAVTPTTAQPSLSNPTGAPKTSVQTKKTGYSTLDNVTGGNIVLGLKKEYEEKNALNPDFAKSEEGIALSKQADDVRREYGLSDDKFGSGVTSVDVANYLKNLKNGTGYQRDLSYQKYDDTNRQLNNELVRELSSEEKMRAVLDRVGAEKIAESMVGAQLDKEIRDSLSYEDELAAQRGSYGQLSYGKRRALKEDTLRDNKAARVQALVQSLIEEDRQKAEQEYKEALTRKENRINVIGQKMNQNTADFQLRQQYQNEISQEETARQQALYENIKTQYDQAFEMSNSLGYITPELSQLTGIEAGTPMFKMVEYYGDLEKFYAELDLEARRVAVEEYYATRPRYSYNGYSGYSGNNNSGKSNLTWNQANAIWQRFSSDYAESNGSNPSSGDLMTYLNQQGFSAEDQEAIMLAAGFTPKNVLEYETAYMNPRDSEGRTM